MSNPVAVDTYDGEIRGMIVPMIPVDMVKIDALFSAGYAASLASILCRVEELKRLWSMSVEDAKYSLAFERLLVVFLTVQRRSLAQLLWAHRALAKFAGARSTVGNAFAFPLRAILAFGQSRLRWAFTPCAESFPHPTDVTNGVHMQSETSRCLRDVPLSLIEHFENRLAINSDPAWHGCSPVLSTKAYAQNVHVGNSATRESRVQRAVLLAK